jgi:hypothetical protein
MLLIWFRRVGARVSWLEIRRFNLPHHRSRLSTLIAIMPLSNKLDDF